MLHDGEVVIDTDKDAMEEDAVRSADLAAEATTNRTVRVDPRRDDAQTVLSSFASIAAQTPVVVAPARAPGDLCEICQLGMDTHEHDPDFDPTAAADDDDDEAAAVSWIMCGRTNCQKWFGMSCLGMDRVTFDRAVAGDWRCRACLGYRPENPSGQPAAQPAQTNATGPRHDPFVNASNAQSASDLASWRALR